LFIRLIPYFYVVVDLKINRNCFILSEVFVGGKTISDGSTLSILLKQLTGPSDLITLLVGAVNKKASPSNISIISL